MKKGKIGARSSGRIFVAVTVGITVVILVSSLAGGGDVLKKLLSADPFWIALSLLNALAIIFVDSLRISLLSKGCENRVSLWQGMKASIYGFYASAITPFASGGQPFQIYYLNRIGLRVERASMIVGVKFISSFTISVIWGMFAITFYGDEIASVKYLGKFMYVGIAATLIFYFFFLLLVLSAKFGKWFLSLPVVVAPMAFFLKKKKEEIYSAVDEKVKAYKNMLFTVWRDSKGPLMLTIVLSFVMVTLILSAPYMAVRSVGGDVPFLKSLSMMAAMSMIFYFIPTPGASGGVEGVFYLVFSKLVSSDIAASALIVWRLFSYHLSLILGMILGFGYIARGDKVGGGAE